MNKAIATREKLLTEGRRLIWSRGYSNVSLREIAQAAGVDVALVSRYFGGKLGLFEATLEGAFDLPDIPEALDLPDVIVAMFQTGPRGAENPSILTLLLTNAQDSDVGQMVRDAQAEKMQGVLEKLIGDAQKAALLMAALFGFAVAEKALKLKAIPPYDTPEYEVQLRYLINSALSFEA